MTTILELRDNKTLRQKPRRLLQHGRLLAQLNYSKAQNNEDFTSHSGPVQFLHCGQSLSMLAPARDPSYSIESKRDEREAEHPFTVHSERVSATGCGAFCGLSTVPTMARAYGRLKRGGSMLFLRTTRIKVKVSLTPPPSHNERPGSKSEPGR